MHLQVWDNCSIHEKFYNYRGLIIVVGVGHEKFLFWVILICMEVILSSRSFRFRAFFANVSILMRERKARNHNVGEDKLINKPYLVKNFLFEHNKHFRAKKNHQLHNNNELPVLCEMLSCIQSLRSKSEHTIVYIPDKNERPKLVPQ